MTCRPILSRIVSLQAEQNDLEYAVPGGLIGHTPSPRSPRFRLSFCLSVHLSVLDVCEGMSIYGVLVLWRV